ncbi:MAG: SDR family NAD(P)-dependent oxidoreductase [Pseudomonadota bacterium]
MTSTRQVALITGAGSGIGLATADGMAAAGRAVVCVDIDEQAATAAADKVRAHGGEVLALAADAGDVEAIERMLDATIEQFGQLDVIVNNAGVTRAADIMDVTEHDWDRIHRVNAKGVFFCVQGAARRMIDRGAGGRIINIASIAGRGYKHSSNAAYAASKGAVMSLTMLAAQQLGRYDINVNSICPGVTLTPIVQSIIAARADDRGLTEAEVRRDYTKDIPIRRANDPEDVAALAVFLASSGARNITGQNYNIDGGLVPT